QASFTCRRGPGARSPGARSTATATATAAPSSTIRVAAEMPARPPAAPRRAPATAPAPVAATAKAVTVIPHRLPRLRSPSGVMLPSIDSPQGDHSERRPATTASGTATTSSAGAVTGPRGVGPEAGMVGADAGGRQLALGRALATGHVVLGVGEQREHLVEALRRALAGQVTAAVDVHEVRAGGDVVVGPGVAGHDDAHARRRQLAQPHRALVARILGDDDQADALGQAGARVGECLPEAGACAAPRRQE